MNTYMYTTFIIRYGSIHLLLAYCSTLALEIWLSIQRHKEVYVMKLFRSAFWRCNICWFCFTLSMSMICSVLILNYKFAAQSETTHIFTIHLFYFQSVFFLVWFCEMWATGEKRKKFPDTGKQDTSDSI